MMKSSFKIFLFPFVYIYVLNLFINSIGGRSVNYDDSFNPLCPNEQSSPFDYFSYDPVTKKCYSVSWSDSQNPCGENEEFYARPDNSSYGICDCNRRIPAYYSPKTKKCHLIFHQEFCKSGEWLQLRADGTLECRPNPCLNYKSPAAQSVYQNNNNYTNYDEKYVVLYNGKCMMIDEPCGEDKDIEIVKIYPPNPEPVCGILFASAGSGLSALQCTPGSKWSHLTDSCKKSVDIQLS